MQFPQSLEQRPKLLALVEDLQMQQVLLEAEGGVEVVWGVGKGKGVANGLEGVVKGKVMAQQQIYKGSH